MARQTRNLIRLLVAALIVTAVLLYQHWWNGQPNRPLRGQFLGQPFGPPIPSEEVDTPEPTCIKNLRFIGAALSDWFHNHNEQYPWNVSTNAGGVRELCAIDTNGFVIDSAAAFQLLANKDELESPLYSPLALICPQDHAKVAAASFAALKAENVTYRLHVGTNLIGLPPINVRVLCPIDGNILDVNGTIFPGKKHAARR